MIHWWTVLEFVSEPATITERLGQMFGKTSHGMKFHAAQRLDALKASLNEQIKQIRAAIVLVRNGKFLKNCFGKVLGNEG